MKSLASAPMTHSYTSRQNAKAPLTFTPRKQTPWDKVRSDMGDAEARNELAEYIENFFDEED